MDFLPALLGGVAAALVVPHISRSIQRGRPFELSGHNGAIRPDRLTAWSGVAFSATAIAGSFALIAFEDAEGSIFVGSLLILIGLAMGAMAIPIFSESQVLRWNDQGVSGPSAGAWPFHRQSPNTIGWEEIASIGHSTWGYWFIEARDGRRIYWAYTHKGCAWLAAALRRKRPELPLPPDMKVAA